MECSNASNLAGDSANIPFIDHVVFKRSSFNKRSYSLGGKSFSKRYRGSKHRIDKILINEVIFL
jgi:hypothetical protein